MEAKIELNLSVSLWLGDAGMLDGQHPQFSSNSVCIARVRIWDVISS